MGLPKQIRKQIKEGAKIEDSIRKELLESNGPDPTQLEIDALMKEVDPEAKKPEGEPAATVTELHPEKPLEGGDPESAPAEEPKPERTDRKQKYNVLQGKYDAEVPRLSSDLREAVNRIKDLEVKTFWSFFYLPNIGDD